MGRGNGEEGLARTMKKFLGHSASEILTAVAKHLKRDAYEIEFNSSGCYLGFGQLASGSDQLLVDYSSINWVWVFNSAFFRESAFGKKHMNVLNEMRRHNYKSTLLEDLDEEEREYISGMVLSDMVKHAKTCSFGIWISNPFSYAEADMFVPILEKGGSLEKLVIELELEGLLGMEGKEQ